MRNSKRLLLVACVVGGFSACKKDKDPIIVVPASQGTERIVLDGIAGTEPGQSAANSVYLDLSGDKASPVARASWDLGFYCGSDFRVILNNTTSAAVQVLDKFNLASVTAADTAGLSLAVSQTDPQPADLEHFDDASGDLDKTAIPAISPVDDSNPVIILNRGTGGGIAPRSWIKMRIFRNGTGYTIKYAGIQDSDFKMINVAKDLDYNFQFFSFEHGPVKVEPQKKKWDIVWTYSVFETDFGWGKVPYNFSDLIGVNYLAGVQVKEKIYENSNVANTAYSAFNADSLATNEVVDGRWTIGSHWRSTMPATGAKSDRFYIIKDAGGNYYKFKALSMGAGNDGGTRGKPEFKYALIK